jgi:hypothetical protein
MPDMIRTSKSLHELVFGATISHNAQVPLFADGGVTVAIRVAVCM